MFGYVDEASAPVGLAAMRVDTDTYRLVYFGFGFEAIDSLEMRREVMSRVLGWLIGAGVQGNVRPDGDPARSRRRLTVVGVVPSGLFNGDASVAVAMKNVGEALDKLWR